MVLTLNIGNANKVFSSATYVNTGPLAATLVKPSIKGITLKGFTSPTLLMNFMTLPTQMYDKIEPKNITTYNQYATYTFNNTQTITAGRTETVSSLSVQLNQIPQKIIIVARKKLTEQNWNDSNSFLCIKKISFNFNNNSGLLSSANTQQLFNMSKRNGIHQNYYEFSGTGVQVMSAASAENVKTTGSVLVIDPSLDLGLDAMYANGSGGQYNCQFNVDIFNQSGQNIAPEILMICVNSGVFITHNGQSEFKTGLFTQEMVLETRAKKSILDSMTYTNLVGGALENIQSVHKHLKHIFKGHKEHEDDLDNGQSETAGAAMSAGVMSGGAKRGKRIHNFLK